MAETDYNLIADIGGTHARFALVETGTIVPLQAKTLRGEEYPDIADAIRSYIESIGCSMPARVALAVAGPVTSDNVEMTNSDWQFSVAALRANLGVQQLKVINDFTALALGLPHFSPEHYHKIGAGKKNNHYAKALLGPGTGLGMSGVIPSGKRWYPIEGEGGHASYGPLTEREAAVMAVMHTDGQPFSAEHLVSGGGLRAMYAAMTELKTGQANWLQPAEVTQQALDGTCAIAEQTLSMFCEVLGTVAGNLALTLGARGGVYIGGGIVPRILDYFIDSDFRARFEGTGKMAGYLSAIPTYVIIERYPALIGISLSFAKKYKNLGVVSNA